MGGRRKMHVPQGKIFSFEAQQNHRVGCHEAPLFFPASSLPHSAFLSHPRPPPTQPPSYSSHFNKRHLDPPQALSSSVSLPTVLHSCQVQLRRLGTAQGYRTDIIDITDLYRYFLADGSQMSSFVCFIWLHWVWVAACGIFS